MKHVSMLLAILSGYFLPVAALMQGLACAPMPLPSLSTPLVRTAQSMRLSATRQGMAVMRAGGDGQQGDEGDSFVNWNPDDDQALRDHIEQTTSSVARLGKPQSVMQDMDSAWVLIFNPGQVDEGVYTLQGRSEQASAYVLAFERTDDADRFAQLLQAEGFDLATAMCWDAEQLQTFCDAGQFEVSLVPKGTLLTPPSKNEYDNDAFARIGADGADPEGTFSDMERRFPGDGSDMPDAFAMERQRLEALLPQQPDDCNDDDCTLPDSPSF